MANPANKRQTQQFLSKVQATKLMNTFLSVLYSEGFWIEAEKGGKLGRLLRAFLVLYQKCSMLAMRKQLNRFPHVPKGHMMSHTAELMIWESEQGEWIINPLSTGNQQQEDFIGRPCRLSRRVHAARLHLRVIQRSMLACYQALHP